MEKTEIYKKLSEPFTAVTPDGEIVPAHKWRVQSGNRCIPYIDARQVSKRFNDVLGIENWSHIIEETNQKMLICTITIKIDGEEFSHSDVGTPANVEKEKSMASDALKRAAVHFGVGAYIYEIKPVEVKDQAIKKDPEKLTSFINTGNPMKLKLAEIWNSVPADKQKSVESEFKKIWEAIR